MFVTKNGGVVRFTGVDAKLEKSQLPRQLPLRSSLLFHCATAGDKATPVSCAKASSSWF